MNKTISINIAGIVFYVEETAYDALHDYLNSIRNRLKNTEGAEEIMQDIESRIAEMFSEMLSSKQEVILQKNVDEVMKAMGKPDDFVLDENDFEEQSEPRREQQFQQEYGARKQLMRDPENAVVAGVCAGIASYLQWDKAVVRIVFILAFFFTGLGLLAYLILWLALPRAVTSSDRLRMQGKPINVDTIAQEVREASERLERYASGPAMKKNIQELKERSGEFGAVFKRFFGGLLILGGTVGIALFLGFSLLENGFFVDYDGESPISLFHFSEIVFNTQTQSYLGWFAILSSTLVPLLFLVILGVFLLFEIKGKALARIFLSFLSLWVVGLITFFIVGGLIARDFTYNEEAEEKIGSIYSPQMIVEVPNLDLFEGNHILESEGDFRVAVKDQEVHFGSVKIHVADSPDSLYHVYRVKEASGISRRRAYARISGINHQITLDSNKVKIAPDFVFPITDRYRAQRVEVRIEVPKGKSFQWIGETKGLYEIHDSRESEWARDDF